MLPQITWQLIRRRHEWDAACICGPHLIGLTVALVCEVLRRPYILVIRENLLTRLQWRYSGILRSIALLQGKLLEFVFMRLSRIHPTLIVGDEMQEKYQRVGAQVRPLFVSLVTKEQLWSREIVKTVSDGTPFHLLYVGRVDPDKGLKFLIDAVADLIRLDKNVHLNIVGVGSERNSLESMVDALAIQPHVSFCGYVPFGPQLLQYYHEADAFVLSSLSEGFPQVVIEAMANSLPSAYQTAQSLTKEAQVAVLIDTLKEVI
jgi:glycosyltransferase involved in cell wall biosynthesis